ncbi:MAG: type II secretion system protein [Phycisphaerales bacterium]
MNDLNGRRGFTVVELSVLIVAMGSLGGVLIPAGNQLQKNNLDTRSQWVHHDLARRQMMYMGDNKGAFTGPNTSGLEWNRISVVPGEGVIGYWRQLEGDQSSSTPTSVSDWISPIAGDAVGLSSNRAQRLQQVLETFGDPTASMHADTLYFGSSIPSDLTDFEEIFNTIGYRQGSFLMMRSFTHFSSEHAAIESIDGPGAANFQYFAVQSLDGPASSPKGYAPSVWNVGVQLSNKVMFADGTRYYEDDIGLSLNVESEQARFSDHTSTGPILDSSTAYGRESGSAPSQANTDLSFRKQGGAGMYATMFDGSLRYMSREEAWTDPTPWYPSGSVWQGNGATPESQAWVEKNLVDGVIH